MGDDKLQVWEDKLLVSCVINADEEADEGKLTTVDECCCPQPPDQCEVWCTGYIPDAWELTVSGFSGSSDYCSTYQCACEDGTYYLETDDVDPCFAETGAGAGDANCRICQIDHFTFRISKPADDVLVTIVAQDGASPRNDIYTWQKNYELAEIDCWVIDDDIPWLSTDASAECTPPATVHIRNAHGAAATNWPTELCRNCDGCGINFPAQVRVIPSTNVRNELCQPPWWPDQYRFDGECAEKFEQIVYLDRLTCTTSELDVTECIYQGHIVDYVANCQYCRHDLDYYPNNNISLTIVKDPAGAATTTLRLVIESAGYSNPPGTQNVDWTWEETYAIDGFDCNNMDVSLPMTNNPLCYHDYGYPLGGSMCEFIDSTAQVTAVV